MSCTPIILAGGLGTRLRPRIADLPKPMAPVAGRPFLSYLLDRLSAFGHRRAVLSVGYRADAIERYFGRKYEGMELVYSYEDEPLGTGGAIARAVGSCDSNAFLALNGDTYLDIDYRKFAQFHRDSGARLSLALRHVPDAGRYGSVRVENGKIVGFDEKGMAGSGWVNAGTYMFERGLFDGVGLPAKFSFELDFLVPYCPEIKPGAFLSDGYMIDIGIPEDFDRAQIELPIRTSAP